MTRIRRRAFAARLILASVLFVAAVRGAGAQGLFWDRPDALSAAGVRFSSVAATQQSLVVAWEEIVPSAVRTEGTIYVSLAARGPQADWRYRYRVVGPIRYSGLDPGSEPLVYSMAVDKGRVLLAVATDEREISIFEGDDQLSFRQLTRLSTQVSVVTPNLFVTSRGSLLLLVTQASGAADATTSGDSVTLLWTRSSDGKSWNALAPFVGSTEPGAGVQLQPDHASFHGKEVVVFQSQRSVTEGYQIFAKISPDGGETWQPAQAITSLPAFDQTVSGTDFKAANFSNARPRLSLLGDTLAMAWERNLLGVASPVIYYCELNEKAEVTHPAEPVSGSAPAIMAQPVRLADHDYLLYAESVAGAYRVVLSEHRGNTWIPSVLGQTLSGSSRTPQGIQLGGTPLILWETTTANGTALEELRTKTRVLAPVLVASGFTPGRPSRADRATIRWRQPDDSVGIDYYEVTLRFDGAPQGPPRQVDAVSADMSLSQPVDRDGDWQLDVSSVDLAGNQSSPATIDFIRDTTPPQAVVLTPPPMDATGRYVSSNSFTVTWAPAPEDTDIVGYTWEEQRVASTESSYEANPVRLIEPPARVLTTEEKLAFVNLEDGVYVVTVRAMDQAGNLGEPARIELQLDKFQPFTFVYTVLQNPDDLGNVQLTIRGRGFLTNGAVRELYLSRSDTPPYDRVIAASGFRWSVTLEISGPCWTTPCPAEATGWVSSRRVPNRTSGPAGGSTFRLRARCGSATSACFSPGGSPAAFPGTRCPSNGSCCPWSP